MLFTATAICKFATKECGNFVIKTKLFAFNLDRVPGSFPYGIGGQNHYVIITIRRESILLLPSSSLLV